MMECLVVFTRSVSASVMTGVSACRQHNTTLIGHLLQRNMERCRRIVLNISCRKPPQNFLRRSPAWRWW